MGTLLEVTVYVPDREQGSRLLDDLFAVAHRLDAALTTFDTNSPVWRLAERAGQGPQRTDPDLADALALSVDYWRSTRGTFDVTVKPLSDLWHAAGRDEKPPSPGALARTLSIIGSDKVLVHSDGSVELKRSGMALDFGGIGKGYALDKMVEVLRAHKVRRAFLSFGQSSIWAIGAPPDSAGWRVLVRRPGGEFAGTATVHDRALSISAALSQTFEINGRRYGHVIDPRIGKPVTRDLEACVIARSAAEAEALSKALLILGAHEGAALLGGFPGSAAVIFDADRRKWMSPGWQSATNFVELRSASAQDF